MNKEHKQFDLPEKKREANIQEFDTKTFLKRGEFTSPNFIKGSRGWKISAEGNAEFNDGTFRGIFNIGNAVITIDNSKNIQDYIDYIFAQGGGVLYLQDGTYTLSDHLTIPSGVKLEGTSRDNVIINCGAYSLKFQGTDSYTSGTIAINDGDTTVVGSSTTFTSSMVGRQIFLGESWYTISAFTDATHITISEAYAGTNLSGYSYAIANIIKGSSISKLTITGATGAGCVMRYIKECNIADCVIYGNGTGIDIDFAQFPRIEVSNYDNGINIDMNFCYGFKIDFCEFSYSTSGSGMVATYSGNSTIIDSAFSNNTGDGVNLTNCSNMAFISFGLENNGGQGIEMVSSCTDNQLLAGIIRGNTSDGIKLTATSDRNTINSVALLDNGAFGINIANANCDNNILVGVNASGNSSGSLSDSGTGTLKSTAVNIIP